MSVQVALLSDIQRWDIIIDNYGDYSNISQEQNINIHKMTKLGSRVHSLAQS